MNLRVQGVLGFRGLAAETPRAVGCAMERTGMLLLALAGRFCRGYALPTRARTVSGVKFGGYVVEYRLLEIWKGGMLLRLRDGGGLDWDSLSLIRSNDLRIVCDRRSTGKPDARCHFASTL